MNKRLLRQIVVELATPDMIAMAKGLEKTKTSPAYIATASIENIDDEDILVLQFFPVSTLKEDRIEPVMRTFHSRTDYIHQDLLAEKTKWLTASYERMSYGSPIGNGVISSYYDYDRSKSIWFPRVIFRSRREQLLAGNYFDGLAEAEDDLYPWNVINKAQYKIMGKRLDDRRASELAETDAIMAAIEPEPEEFRQWVWDEGMKESRYLVFTVTDRNHARCQCTHCGHIGIVDRRKIKFKNGEWAACPFCGSEVFARAKKTMAYHSSDRKYFMYIDPREGSFWVRIFFAFRSYVNGESIWPGNIDKTSKDVEVSQGMWEVRRAFYTFPANGAVRYEPFEWGLYKNHGNLRWCPNLEKEPCWLNTLYPGNLPEAWGDTPLKYCALEILARDPNVNIRYENAFEDCVNFPKMEWIIKMGLTHLAADLLGHGGDCINHKGETIYDILRIKKQDVKILQELNGGSQMLNLLQEIERMKLNLTVDQVREYYEVFRDDDTFLMKSERPVSIHKLCRYIKEESRAYKIRESRCAWDHRPAERLRIENMVHDWKDYLRYCRELGYDTTDKYWFMPHNFIPVHDRIYKEYQDRLDEIEAAKKKKEAEELAARMKKVKAEMDEMFRECIDDNGVVMKGGGLMIVVPSCSEDLKAEGEALHHCVGTYAQRVANGETNIFFVRKTKAPDVPYFTMEFRNGRVIQCRGNHNCGMPVNVEAFVKVFEQKMQEAAKEIQLRKAG